MAFSFCLHECRGKVGLSERVAIYKQGGECSSENEFVRTGSETCSLKNNKKTHVLFNSPNLGYLVMVAQSRLIQW